VRPLCNARYLRVAGAHPKRSERRDGPVLPPPSIMNCYTMHEALVWALLHKSGFDRTSPFPRRAYPTNSVTCTSPSPSPRSPAHSARVPLGQAALAATSWRCANSWTMSFRPIRRMGSRSCRSGRSGTSCASGMAAQTTRRRPSDLSPRSGRPSSTFNAICSDSRRRKTSFSA